MAQVSPRVAINGSPLVRVLSRLADSDPREPAPAGSDLWSHWFGWTDAISLSAALNAESRTSSARARALGDAVEGECSRVRNTLKNAIAEEGLHVPDAGVTSGFGPFRQRYLTRQQAMASRIAELRGRLRAALAARSPALARLAAVDAVTEQVLGARENSLLASVPALLAKHFEHLRRSEQAPAGSDAQPLPGTWLETFCKDMQDLLLAELDFRLQPIEGLLEALRAKQADRP